MFVIIARTIGDDGSPLEGVPVTQGFYTRETAVQHLKGLMRQHRPNAKYDAIKDCWQVTSHGVVTTYTVESKPTVTPWPS